MSKYKKVRQNQHYMYKAKKMLLSIESDTECISTSDSEIESHTENYCLKESATTDGFKLN